MTCKHCAVEIDTSKNEIPPKWFGKYVSGKLIDVICAVCLKSEKGRQLWAQ